MTNRDLHFCAICQHFEKVNEQTGFCTYLKKVASNYDNTCPLFKSDLNGKEGPKYPSDTLR